MARVLSLEGHAHRAERDKLNFEASQWIIAANNERSPKGTIDLHGLYVGEASRETGDFISVSFLLLLS